MSTSVAGILDDAYVSSVDFLHDRDIYNELFDAINESSILHFFELTGREISSHQTEWHHHEKDFIYKNITILANAPSGADVLITLSPANHDGTQSYPIVGGMVMFKNQTIGLIVAKDETAPTAHVITVRKIKPADDVNVAAVNTEVLAMHSNAFAEGTGQPDGYIHKPIQYEGTHHIFKTSVPITGSEMTNRVEVTVHGGSKYYMYEAEHDAFLHHQGDCAFGLLFNSQSDGLVNSAGKEVRVAKGLTEWITDEGNIFNGGIGALTDFDTIIKVLNKERGSKENLWLPGINQDIDIDNVLINEMQSGGISYNTFGKGDAKQRAIDMGFSSFRKGSYMFHKKMLDEFNHPNVSGSVGHTWPDTGLIIPTDKGSDAKTGKSIHSIALRAKKAPNFDRTYHHWTGGIWAGKPIGDLDQITFEYLSEKSIEPFGLHRFFRVNP